MCKCLYRYIYIYIYVYASVNVYVNVYIYMLSHWFIDWLIGSLIHWLVAWLTKKNQQDYTTSKRNIRKMIGRNIHIYVGSFEKKNHQYKSMVYSDKVRKHVQKTVYVYVWTLLTCWHWCRSWSLMFLDTIIHSISIEVRSVNHVLTDHTVWLFISTEYQTRCILYYKNHHQHSSHYSWKFTRIVVPRWRWKKGFNHGCVLVGPNKANHRSKS